MPPSERSDNVPDTEQRQHRKTAGPLQRGSACLSCRKRKMKCDASKPVCRQCVKANRAEECEYDDGRQKSRTQILQEKISKLEERIRELEVPVDGDDLHNSDYDPNDPSSLSDFNNCDPAPFASSDELELDAGISVGMALGMGSGLGVGVHFAQDGSSYGGMGMNMGMNLGAPGSYFDGSPPGSSAGSAAGSATFSPLALGGAVPLPSQGLSPDPMFFALPPGSPGSSNGSHSDGSSSGGSRQARQSWDTTHNGQPRLTLQQPQGDFMYSQLQTPTTGNAYGFPTGAIDPALTAQFVNNAVSGSSTDTAATFGGLYVGYKQQDQTDELPLRDRKILLDVFLPHARQCGLDTPQALLRARLGLPADDFSSAQAPIVSPAHPALSNAIYLLACHFSSVSSSSLPSSLSSSSSSSDSSSSRPTSSPSIHSSNTHSYPKQRSTNSRSATPSTPDLSSHEPRFLALALRGIAAALEAGETASSSAVFPASSYDLGLPASFEPPPPAGTPLVDAVQASALLAVYFFSQARLLEGYYHASAAARLAVALGMHQIKSPVWRPSSRSAIDDGVSGLGGTQNNTGAPAVPLPAPRDPAELAERVRVFWQVFVVDRCWSVATGLPASLPDDEHPQLRICTIWPWDGSREISRPEADYSSLNSLFELSNRQQQKNHTLLSGQKGGSICVKNLKAKAAAFFERASRVAAMHVEGNQWEQICQVEYLIAQFVSVLPSYKGAQNVASSPSPSLSHSMPPSTSASPVPGVTASSLAAGPLADTIHEDLQRYSSQSRANTFPMVIPSHRPVRSNSSASFSGASTHLFIPSVDCEIASVHILAHAATIQLFHPIAQREAGAHAKCVNAARAVTAIIRDLDESDYALLDPIVGTCWMCVSDAFIRERMWNKEPFDGSGSGHRIEEELETVINALRRLGRIFPVAAYQAQKVEQTRNSPF